MRLNCQSCGFEDALGYPLKFYYGEGEPKELCYKCHPNYWLHTKSTLHRLVDHANPRVDRNYTVAKDEVIMNSIVCPDDNHTIIDRRTGKEAPY